MSASVIGVALTWKEGARLFSLAMAPLLLKMAGAAVFAWVTSLSPFYFNAGPALFFNAPPVLVQRLDLFELWSVALLWGLMRHRPAGSDKRAAITTGLVWVTAMLLSMAFGKLGA
jgi:hypothetical protein